jgi:MOSC domain-containing protein YiiM
VKLLSVNVGGPVRVGRESLEGDEQADLTVHGGVDKAVYAYPAEHYIVVDERNPNAPTIAEIFGRAARLAADEHS